jgi:putative nucleotidyltransferase with HDIG domain
MRVRKPIMGSTSATSSMPVNRVLIVDDEEAIRDVVAAMLGAQGYECSACSNGREAVETVQKKTFDLVLSDLVMPEMDGMAMLERLREFDPDLPVVMVTAMHDVSTALEAIRKGAYDYLLKPFDKNQLFFSVGRAIDHRRVILENREYQLSLEKLVEKRTSELRRTLVQLEESYDQTLQALGRALDLKDAETQGHCERVTAFTIAIAKAMPVDPFLLPHIARAAFLHDIGKMAIPDRILLKPGPLDDAEREVMRSHCEIGYKMLIQIPFLREAAEIVLSHQEFYDGTGYPRALRGDAIPMGARVFAVADALDAMTSDRPYRKALSITYAREEIQRCSGTQFDPEVVERFLAMDNTLWKELRENIGDPFRAFATSLT